MPGKLLQNETMLCPASAEYNICTWSLPAFLKQDQVTEKAPKLNGDCDCGHKLELWALRITVPDGDLQ